MSALPQSQPDPGYVLALALFNVATELGLTQAELGAVIGLHRTGISRLKKNRHLDPDSKTGELALLLIRAARALHAMTGGDKAWILHFMRSRNQVTGGVPAEQIQNIQGLMQVVQYLDAIRGKV